jgi:hypothetical protein
MTASKPKRRKPRPTTPYVWNETRDEFKPEDVQSLVDALLRNYLSTEPSKGKATEARKFEIAEQTIDLFWRLFDMLGYWAQAQIVGKVWAEANPKLANQLAELWSIADGIEFDSHVLERFGSEFGQSRGWIGEPIFDFLASREDLDEQTQLSAACVARGNAPPALLRSASKLLLAETTSGRSKGSQFRTNRRAAGTGAKSSKSGFLRNACP